MIALLYPFWRPRSFAFVTEPVCQGSKSRQVLNPKQNKKWLFCALMTVIPALSSFTPTCCCPIATVFFISRCRVPVTPYLFCLISLDLSFLSRLVFTLLFFPALFFFIIFLVENSCLGWCLQAGQCSCRSHNHSGDNKSSTS